MSSSPMGIRFLWASSKFYELIAMFEVHSGVLNDKLILGNQGENLPMSQVGFPRKQILR